MNVGNDLCVVPCGSISKKSHLPLPMGEVAERSEVGEGLPIFYENRETSNICKANIR